MAKEALKPFTERTYRERQRDNRVAVEPHHSDILGNTQSKNGPAQLGSDFVPLSTLVQAASLQSLSCILGRHSYNKKENKW